MVMDVCKTLLILVTLVLIYAACATVELIFFPGFGLFTSYGG